MGSYVNNPLAFSGEKPATALKQTWNSNKTDKVKWILTIKKGGQKCDTNKEWKVESGK